jgi:predicted DNA-binding ribbon-helix-helix protein
MNCVVHAAGGEVPNFASFLRVTCMRYLQRKTLVKPEPARPNVAVPNVVSLAAAG